MQMRISKTKKTYITFVVTQTWKRFETNKSTQPENNYGKNIRLKMKKTTKSSDQQLEEEHNLNKRNGL